MDLLELQFLDYFQNFQLKSFGTIFIKFDVLLYILVTVIANTCLFWKQGFHVSCVPTSYLISVKGSLKSFYKAITMFLDPMCEISYMNFLFGFFFSLWHISVLNFWFTDYIMHLKFWEIRLVKIYHISSYHMISIENALPSDLLKILWMVWL